MRVLTFTNLYPNTAQPRHGIFIEHRIRQLAASGEVTVRVVAPAPWVPKFAARFFGHFAALADVPAKEVRHGIPIWHPRFFAVPRMTSWLNPFLMALGALRLVKKLRRDEDFDVIDAHFVYPDGAAAVLLGAWLGKPVTVTARGTDINEFPQFRVPRAWIKWVARRADALITVSDALRVALSDLGAAPEKITVLRNGVDLSLFAPRDREASRAQLGFNRSVLLSVGHLIPDKGHQFVIEALTELTDVQLVVVGDGPMREGLRSLARKLGVAERITWTGTLNQQDLALYYSSADVTVLASKLEGMPNVLLESIACGTPVIATNVGGNSEVVSSNVAGVLMTERSARGVASAYRTLTSNGIDRGRVRAHAQQFGWEPTTQGLLKLFAASTNKSSPLSDSRRTSAPGLG